MIIERGDKVKIKEGYSKYTTGKVGYVERCKIDGSKTYFDILFLEAIPVDYSMGLIIRVEEEHRLQIADKYIEILEKVDNTTFRKRDKVKIINKTDCFYGKVVTISNIVEKENIKVCAIKDSGDNFYYDWEMELVERLPLELIL